MVQKHVTATPRIDPMARQLRGKMPFVPTDADRHVVERLAGFGFRFTDICLFIINPKTKRPIHIDTLNWYFQDELERAAPLANSKVMDTLFAIATDPTNPKAITAAIWWSKVRMGWKETINVETQQKTPQEMSLTELEDQLRNIKLKDQTNPDDSDEIEKD